ncbi:MAG: hypothetical protein M1368_09470 [Thaumarchaeota archaeon]|nr:hypothetical protein [Nitrososphaerota archaeon]
MHWIECKRHESIYYDSSVHKICPICANHILGVAFASFVLIAGKELKYAKAVHNWIDLILDSLSVTAEKKSEVVSKREVAFKNMNEISDDIGEMYDSVTDYSKRNDLKTVLVDSMQTFSKGEAEVRRKGIDKDGTNV